VALDAQFVIAGKAGARRVAARDFFEGLYATALRPDEVLTQVEIAVQGPEYRSAFVELAQRRGDYAIVGLAAVAKCARGVLSDLRLAFLGVGPVPMLARGAMAVMEGKRAAADTIAAATKALAKDLEPGPDLYSSAATKMHLARALTGRALTALAA
jgi:carbon-monoxide dehydrogenase medium subunit